MIRLVIVLLLSCEWLPAGQRVDRSTPPFGVGHSIPLHIAAVTRKQTFIETGSRNSEKQSRSMWVDGRPIS